MINRESRCEVQKLSSLDVILAQLSARLPSSTLATSGGFLAQLSTCVWKNMVAKLSKNEMSMFGLHSTSDDQPSNLSDESHPKCEKMATKSSKNEMFIFGLCSTSDDWPSDPSIGSLKCKKMVTKSS